eukprot:COSAG04_NODE_2801_length_3561_cov_1.619006_3_plen_165_part_00
MKLWNWALHKQRRQARKIGGGTKWRWEKINLTGGQGGHAVARPRSCSRSPRCAGASHGAMARPARHLSVSREAAGGVASGAVVCGSCACRTGGSGHDLRRSTAATSPPYPLVLATQQRVDTHYRKHMGRSRTSAPGQAAAMPRRGSGPCSAHSLLDGTVPIASR